MYLRSVMEYSTPKKILNAIRTEVAYRQKSVNVTSMPFILLLEPLYYCNLECPLCDRQVYPNVRKGDAGMMSLELYDRILDEVGPYLFQCQIFGQGEPLMNWKLTREIIARTHARNIFTMISTNATLITPQKAKELVASDLDHLVVAIDGVTQGPYETYRVGGKVQAALDGLRLVVAARSELPGSRMAIEWQYLTHSRNLHEVEPARRMAAELGIGFRTAPIRGMEWDRALEDQWLSPEDERLESGQYVNEFPCYFLWRSLVLNSNGKVARCLVYQNVAQYADLNNMSVREAYNHPSVQAARRLFSKEPMAEPAPSPCNSCGYFERHHGPRPERRQPTALTQNLPQVLPTRDAQREADMVTVSGEVDS
jgi:MoaA/NifB/PqqE/SkfB family radical SAM enzyme